MQATSKPNTNCVFIISQLPCTKFKRAKSRQISPPSHFVRKPKESGKIITRITTAQIGKENQNDDNSLAGGWGAPPSPSYI